MGSRRAALTSVQASHTRHGFRWRILGLVQQGKQSQPAMSTHSGNSVRLHWTPARSPASEKRKASTSGKTPALAHMTAAYASRSGACGEPRTSSDRYWRTRPGRLRSSAVCCCHQMLVSSSSLSLAYQSMKRPLQRTATIHATSASSGAKTPAGEMPLSRPSSFSPAKTRKISTSTQGQPYESR